VSSKDHPLKVLHLVCLSFLPLVLFAFSFCLFCFVFLSLLGFFGILLFQVLSTRHHERVFLLLLVLLQKLSCCLMPDSHVHPTGSC
jgi:hypothetical protein